MEINFLDNIDIYEVDKHDYDSYFYRLPITDLMKTTPYEGLTVYKDITNNEAICGILTENIMAMPANRYFIFNFMDENRLRQYKTYKYVVLNENEYTELLKKLSEITKEKGENA